MKKLFIFTLYIIICIAYFNNSVEARLFENKHFKPAPNITQAPKADPLAEYMTYMEQCIKSNWFPPNNSFKYKTVVDFQILRDGSIRNSRIQTTSGDKEFDKGAILALQKSKLKPLPNTILGDSIEISFTFERLSYLVHKDRYDR